MKFILGKKVEMSQIFDEQGKVTPVTLINAGPCQVAQIKTKEKDGYSAVQIGFENKKKTKESRFLREFQFDKEIKQGDIIDVSIFSPGDKIRISGVSKGKGFQGAVKRWGFSGRNASHGVKHEHRTLGSVGMTGPQRVMKGKKMPGRMGFERITVKNLEIIKVDKENNMLAVKGAVPGRKGILLEIKD